MLVKTPAIKLGVEIRKSKVEGGVLVLAGVANAMPCTVEIGGKEMWSLAGRMLRPSVIWLMLKALVAKPDA
jgi:hypothetical protein